MLIKPLIIVPAFKRHEALKRLLISLEKAEYPVEDIQIVISLDGGYTKEVAEVAYSFMKNFTHGNVKVIERNVNIGLKEHIIWCGDQSFIHGAVIVLEDDLIVDPYFYHFAKSATEYYQDDINIASIALYSPINNDFAYLRFDPMNNGTTGYFMQVTCSWGQIWTNRQWQSFKNWYSNANEDSVLKCPNIPLSIKEWPTSSWKKYFSAYIAQYNLFVFYPYLSYTTNCSDFGGTHEYKGTNKHQVPLASNYRKVDHFNFPEFNYKLSVYDSYMEPISNELLDALGLKLDDIEIDIYGIKPLSILKIKKFVLTTKKVKIAICSYELRFKPFDKVYLSQVDSKNKAHVFLAKSENVISSKANPYQLAVYFAGFNLFSKFFAKEYFSDYLKKLLRLKI
ncbi:MAG: glycosyltransferase [Methylococcaceae bacterium]